jgi:hypothetical protein
MSLWDIFLAEKEATVSEQVTEPEPDEAEPEPEDEAVSDA